MKRIIGICSVLVVSLFLVGCGKAKEPARNNCIETPYNIGMTDGETMSVCRCTVTTCGGESCMQSSGQQLAQCVKGCLLKVLAK